MRIRLANQQHRRSPGPVPGRHVVDAVADHQQAGCCDAPLRRDVQDPRRVGLRGAELARDDGLEGVGGQEGCQEVRDRCSGEGVGLVRGLASLWWCWRVDLACRYPVKGGGGDGGDGGGGEERGEGRRGKGEEIKEGSKTHSKFRVQIPLRSPRESTYAISSTSPSCGFCTRIALRSMFRIFSMAVSCSSSGRV